jgi:dipeptidyl aminopeptidase/acylaminoacyl peptidase
MIRHRFLFSAFVATLATSVAPGAALAERPMGIVDLLNVPVLTDPQLSADGRAVVYTLTEADWKAGRRIRHVWRAKVDGGQPAQMTNGADGESTPRWSPDGKTVAFVAKRGDNESAQVYLLPSDGGEARQLTSHATAVSDIQWAPDGSAVYFLASEPKTAAEKARDKIKDDVYAFDENYEQKQVWKVAVATRVESRITSGDFSVFAYRLSSDGRKIAFHRAPNPLLGSRDQSEVWVMDADGSHALQLTRNAVEEEGAAVSPDDSQVLFLADANDRFENYHTSRLFIVPVTGGPARVVASNAVPYDVERAAWTNDGKTIDFVANLGVHTELFEMPASGGTPRQLTDGKHAIKEWTLADDRHVFTVSDATNPGDVWILSQAARTPTRVTHVFDYLTRDFTLARQEAIQWKGADGATVEGLLSYPIDYKPGQKYPLAVLTHGGPRESDKYGPGRWNYDIQVLAGKGYAVLQPNYRGSTGYGDDVLRDMVGHYFQNAHLDVMAGVDEVIRRGIADPDKLVKAGWSGGGHMTNKIITFTDRFKAAASGAGAANWVSMYAQSDIRANRTPWFGGTPWQKNAPIDVYWNSSPLKDVANVKTPTIFFVGEKDQRVPMPQSIEMYRALKSNGVPTHLYIAPREPHGWEELRHQLFKANAELEWFEKYATKRPYTWEKALDESKKETKIATE